jgi:oxygen-independent coproporphyrinogen-3 oxidase
MIGVYLHIPYCKTLCPYCDFVKDRSRTGVPDPFVDALCNEIAAYEGPRQAGSIFFGGGTPSLLAPTQLARILTALRDTFDLGNEELTLEANPDDLTDALLRAWKDLGVNRVSLGVQSFDPRVLRYLGRRHDADGARRACALVADQFDNWSLDLIFGAPPLDPWQDTLDEAVALDPPHMSAYGLTYEPGTPFARRADEAVDDETSLDLYRMLEETLTAAGYGHYEISNFARPGREARHNLVYWHNGEYAGFGTGAYSYLSGTRARNHHTNDAYLRAPGDKEEALQLTEEEVRVETLIQHFRLRDGLPKDHYTQRFHRDLMSDYGAPLTRLLRDGLLEDTPTHLRPTRKGFYLNNEIGLALV